MSTQKAPTTNSSSSFSSFPYIWTVLVLLVLTLYYYLPQILIRTFIPSATYDQITWRSIQGIHWTSSRLSPISRSPVSPDEEKQEHRYVVDVYKIRWAFNNNRRGTGGWFGILVEGLRIQTYPHSPHSNDSGESHANIKTTKESSSRKLSTSSVKNLILVATKQFISILVIIVRQYLGRFLIFLLSKTPLPIHHFVARVLRFCRVRILRPIITLLYTIGRNLSYIINFFFIDFVNISVDAKSIGRIQSSFRTGLEIKRGPTERRLCVWLRVIELSVCEWEEERQNNTDPAIKLCDPVRWDVSVPFNPSIGLAGIYKRGPNREILLRERTIDVISSFSHFHHASSTTTPVEINVKKLIAISEAIKLAKEERRSLNPETKKTSQQNIANVPHHFHSLRKLLLHLPPVKIVLPYDHPSSDSSPVGSVILCARGLFATVLFGGNLHQDHTSWLASKKPFPISAEFGWRSIELDVHLADRYVAKLFTSGPSTISLSSKWIPPSLSHLFPQLYSQRFPNLRSDEVVIFDAMFGAIGGDVSLDHMRALLDWIENCKAKRVGKSNPSQSTKDKSQFVVPPHCVLSIQIDQGEYKVRGPQSKNNKCTWPLDDFVQIQLPRIELNIHAQCFALIYRHSEANLRRMRRIIRKGRLPYPIPEGLKQSLACQDLDADASVDSSTSMSDTTSEGGTSQFIKFFTPIQRVRTSLDPAYDPSLPYTLRYQVDSHLFVSQAGISIRPSNVSTSLSENASITVLSLGPIEGSSKINILGEEGNAGDGSLPNLPYLHSRTHFGTVKIAIKQFSLQPWREKSVGCVQEVMSIFGRSSGHLRHPRTSTSEGKPIVETLVQNISFYISVEHTHCLLAELDTRSSSQLYHRGINISVKYLCFEFLLQTSSYAAQNRDSSRNRLNLGEDVETHANALYLSDTGKMAALCKLSFDALDISRVVDVKNYRHNHKSSSHRTATKETGAERTSEINEEQPDSLWELRNRASSLDFVKKAKLASSPNPKRTPEKILYIPSATIRFTFRAASRNNSNKDDGPVDDITIAAETPMVHVQIDVFSIYCIMLAISSLTAFKWPSHVTNTTQQKRIPRAVFSIRVEAYTSHIFVTLPSEVHLFFEFRGIEVSRAYQSSVGVLARSGLLAGQSPTVKDCWDDIVRFRGLNAGLELENCRDIRDAIVSIEIDAIRLRIPYGYHLSYVLDNTAAMVKVVKELIHKVIKKKESSVIQPHAEQAKRVPQISLTARIVSFEMMDDPFETSLNRIWRVARDEQNGRLARDKAFEAKAKSTARTSKHSSNGSSSMHSVEDITKACETLNRYNARNWIDRVRNARAEQRRREEALLKRIYGHTNGRPADDNLPIDIVQVLPTAPLFRATLHYVQLSVKSPSFGEEGLPAYLHEVGKGVPYDTRFSTLIPFNIKWTMNEARVVLRDYPLPLLHIPVAHSSSDDMKLPSWTLETDFVIAEEFTDSDLSIRHVDCPITQPISDEDSKGQDEQYTILVPRSGMPTKFYALPRIQISSALPTRICWGNSIQPTIQDVARTFDTITKSPVDPSDRIGFWDKIRLIMHGNIKVDFIGDGDVHMHLKGERDPYALTGDGAGFVMCWRRDVQILLGLENPDKEFLQVKSEDFILAIPDLREWIDEAATGIFAESGDNDSKSAHSTSNSYPDGPHGLRKYPKDAFFIKIAAKFINGVRWGMGIALERSCRDVDKCQNGCKGSPFYRKCRLFEFIPHWQVQTVTSTDDPNHDSYRGFRSDFIHFSISITSPSERPNDNEDAASGINRRDRQYYNSLHFSPEGISHFWAWWGLFNGALSLPIRHGALFPSTTKPSKKFGKHCATLKYRFSLSPLFLAHTYRYEDSRDWEKGETCVMGIKGKIASFNVDLHQRAQEMVVLQPEMHSVKKVSRKRFFIAEVDCENVDLRVVSARFRDPDMQYVVTEATKPNEAEDVELEGSQQNVEDQDLKWVDMDDFTDTDYSITDENPRLQILQLLKSPRFTYFRQPPDRSTADSSDSSTHSVFDSVISKFGSENTHTCLVGHATETIDVQISVTSQRLAELEAQIKDELTNEKLSYIPAPHSRATELHMRMEGTQRILKRLNALKKELTVETAEHKSTGSMPAPLLSRTPHGHVRSSHEDDGEGIHLPHLTSTLYGEWESWINRIILHNPLITFSNGTRDIVLRYYYCLRARKGFAYQMTARAVKFIRDLSDEAEQRRRQSNVQAARNRSRADTFGNRPRKFSQSSRKVTIDDYIGNKQGEQQTNFVSNETVEEGLFDNDSKHLDPNQDAPYGLPSYCDLRHRFLFMIIKPQIALNSDAEEDATVVLTAFRAELKTFQVMDARYRDDPINSSVLHRSFATLDGLQAFYPRRDQSRTIDEGSFPFLPTEVLIDLRLEPWGFDRVVPRTTAKLRLDMFNRYRIRQAKFHSDEGDEHFRNATDRLVVDCAGFSATANPQHFNAIYNVITDLVLYTDPAQRTRAAKIEDMMLVHDWNDLRKLAGKVQDYQNQIRTREAIITSYQPRRDELGSQERIELLGVKREIMILAGELGLLVESLNMAQSSRRDEKNSGFQIDASASQVAWHMMDQNDSPIAKLAVIGATFSWLSKRDSTVANRLVIRDLQALNSSPEQLFTEIIAKHSNVSNDHFLAKKDIFAVLVWNTLSPVGGIDIVEHFELHLHPVRLQIEHVVGRKMVDYLFQSRRHNKEKHLVTQNDTEKSHKRGDKWSALKFDRGKSKAATVKEVTDAESEESDHELSAMSSTSSLSVYEEDSRSISSIADVKNVVLEHIFKNDLMTQNDADQLDVVEMRRRARSNRAFVLVEVSPTVLTLSYKGEKQSSLYDVYDLSFGLPRLSYRNKVLSYLDLMDAMKKDVIKSVWTQTPSLLNQLVTHARKPKAIATKQKEKARTFTKMKMRITGGGRKKATSPLKKVTAASPSPIDNTTSEQNEESHVAEDNRELQESPEPMSDDEEVRAGELYADVPPRSSSEADLDEIKAEEVDYLGLRLTPPLPTQQSHFNTAPLPRPRRISEMTTSTVQSSIPLTSSPPKMSTSGNSKHDRHSSSKNTPEADKARMILGKSLDS